jgi:hypothetical protein
MSRILKKMEININTESEEDSVVGTQLIKQIAENLYLVQNEVNEFLGDLAGVEDFGKLPIKESLKLIKEFKELDGIADFFKSAGL